VKASASDHQQIGPSRELRQRLDGPTGVADVDPTFEAVAYLCVELVEHMAHRIAGVHRDIDVRDTDKLERPVGGAQASRLPGRLQRLRRTVDAAHDAVEDSGRYRRRLNRHRCSLCLAMNAKATARSPKNDVNESPPTNHVQPSVKSIRPPSA
jgi:hypothetical protein